ncbi:hypothetical protein [Hyphomicrobium sp. ghe19]|uniref:hypothetical protein n=1 Tax=Hyphomicrobium sp. ghe19 TaxID=2682968 RepID=UPI001367689C|nr:hypothetical protein HYPP_02098 [Hyphomicrobium sp. ghe19]
MRKKAVNQVYDVLKAVYELEKELKAAPTYLDIANPDECTRHLREARHQLHEVLNEVCASDFRNRKVAA